MSERSEGRDAAPAPGPSFAEIAETFELMDDWDERYRYVIELGRAMPGLEESERTDARKVEGCASRVWLATELRAAGDDATVRLFFRGESDAHIVRGLIAVLRALVSGRPARDVAALDIVDALEKIGLGSALSAQRSNGLRAMAERLKSVAASAEA